MPTELPLDALEMALWIRARAGQDVTGVIHHSDAGSQYTSIRYTDRLADAGALASIGTVGDSYDNALAESVIGLYKTECVRRDGPCRGVDDLELATLTWVHWFNHQPPALRARLRPTGRVRAALLPSDQPPTAAAAGRTDPPLNPGRFTAPPAPGHDRPTQRAPMPPSSAPLSVTEPHPFGSPTRPARDIRPRWPSPTMTASSVRLSPAEATPRTWDTLPCCAYRHLGRPDNIA